MEAKLALEVRRHRVLHSAWLAIQRNARTSKSQDTRQEIANFASNLETNLGRIKRQLQRNSFVFLPAKGVKIPKDKKDKSKFRPLVVAKVESRVVQRAIHDVLVSVPAIQAYVKTPHSFGGIKKADEDDMAAVPAAIQEVLNAIGNGGKFIIRSDISSFFTTIKKSAVTAIIAKAIDDDEFMALFTKAIAVELENMAELRSHKDAFPIEDIGVAQGNSLSPLLGNIILYSFDRELNAKRDVRCIRYIDDFIIIAPSKSVAENTFGRAQHLLSALGMSVSPSKTQKALVKDGFEFLGIELVNGFIRPAKKSRDRMIASVKQALAESTRAMRDLKKTGHLDRAMSLPAALHRAGGIMRGWAKHYRFCNDGECLRQIDVQTSKMIKNYLSSYRDVLEKSDEFSRWKLLGIEAVSQIERQPFAWPRQTASLSSASYLELLEVIETNPDAVPWAST